MNSTTDVLDRVVADLDAVLSGDVLAGLPDAERMDVLRVAGAAFRRIEAVVVETTASADPEFSHSFGSRGTNELLQRVLRVDVAGATRVGKVADAVRRDVSVSSGERLPARYPALREAMLDGVVGVSGFLAAISPIDKAAHRFGREMLLEADAALADYARGCRVTGDGDGDGDVADSGEGARAGDDEVAPPATPEDLRQFALVLAMVLGPDGPEPSEQGARHQRSLTIGRLKDGLHAIRGHLLPDVAAQLQAIIDAQCNPKTDGPPMPGVQFQDSEDVDDSVTGDAGDAGGSESFDTRSAAQKRHDALAAALGIAARHEEMPTLGGAPPTWWCMWMRRMSPPVRGGRGSRDPSRPWGCMWRRTRRARGRFSGCCSMRVGSWGSRSPTLSSRCISDGRFSPATRSA